MARNCEKKLVGLNRLWLAKQQKEELERNPKRPHLRSLNNAAEVKRWIPGIKREMDYYLDQLSGARQHRYPDTKIKEFEKKVEELENEYKRFVKKVFELDPSTTEIPWQPRGYVSKRKNMGSSQNEIKPKKICTPLLENEVNFVTPKRDGECTEIDKLTDCNRTHGSPEALKTNEVRNSVLTKSDSNCSESDKLTDCSTTHGSEDEDLKVNEDNNFKLHNNDHVDVQSKNVLGLDYESSSDSDVS